MGDIGETKPNIINGKLGTDKRWSLNGATALVTGGTKGIGRAIVEELAAFGASVHTCSRNELELNECLQNWSKSNFRVTGSVCDVSSRAEREKLMETVTSVFHGKLNILINNAGTFIAKPCEAWTAEDYSFIMATNFESAFHLCQLAHSLMKASGEGSIVFISSIAGVVPVPKLSIYAASKGAINQLTKNLACEWAKDNIRSNCVAPGVIKTNLTRILSERKELEEKAAAGTLVGRLGESEEVAAMAIFLCLPVASYITGQIICVDGGRILNLSNNLV